MTAALIERLEKAEAGGDREIDAELWLMFTPGATRKASVVKSSKGLWPDYTIDETREASGRLIIVPAFTSSLDAALALAERVLPGFRRHLNELPPSSGLGWEATVWTDAADLSAHPSRGPTAPLALCIAILKAKAAQS